MNSKKIGDEEALNLLLRCEGAMVREIERGGGGSGEGGEAEV